MVRKTLIGQNQNNWFFSNSAALIAAFSAVAIAVFGIIQWTGTARQAKDKDRQDRAEERRKEAAAQKKELRDRAEERFKTAVTALGDEKEGTQVGGAILLRSFLNEEDKEIYERYYTQIFDLAVAYLSPLRTPHPAKDTNTGTPNPPVDPNTPLLLTPLRKALIMVFKEAFLRARDELEKQKEDLFDPRLLDASHTQLDNAYLAHANLSNAWMPEAFLRKANLGEANLSKANLRHANFTEAHLGKACLDGANLRHADLSGVVPNEGTFLIDLSSISLKDTDLRGVKGLTKEQLEACKAKGAIIDEDTTTSPPQSPAAPPVPSQSNDAQTPSAPPAQGNLPPPDDGGGNAVSSQQNSES